MKVFQVKRPAQSLTTPPIEVAPGADPAALLAEQQARIQATTEAEAAKQEAAEAKAAVARMQAEVNANLINSTITGLAAKARAMNPIHAVALLANQFEVKDGKVVYKADPSKAPDVVTSEFFNGDGKYLVSSSVPTGAGAGSYVTAPTMQAPKDLTSAEGLTRFVRGMTHGPQVAAQPAAGQPAATPGAPVNGAPPPAAPGARAM